MSLLACVTVPDGATARTLAHLVVERRLGRRGEHPARSPFHLSLGRQGPRKPRMPAAGPGQPAAWEDFRAAVEAAHPYEVPCIVGMPLEKGNAPFLDWIAQNSLPAGQLNE